MKDTEEIKIAEMILQARKDLAMIERINKCVKDEFGQPLICYGCAHSMGCGQEGADFPGLPSGERPCHFCIRNAKRDLGLQLTTWYDGTPAVKVPMDCYQTIDMINQEQMGEGE